jgi:hypothetical protein
MCKVQSMVQGSAFVNMVQGAEYGPSVGYCEHGEWCRVWSKGGHLLTWCKVQIMVQVWAIVNMVSAADYGPRVCYCERGEWYRGWSKCGCLLTWCMHFIKTRNSVTTRLASYLSFPCCS